MNEKIQIMLILTFDVPNFATSLSVFCKRKKSEVILIITYVIANNYLENMRIRCHIMGINKIFVVVTFMIYHIPVLK